MARSELDTALRRTTYSRAWAAALVSGAAGICVFLYWVTPGESRLLPPCPFHWVTGLYCPGCGSLRGLHHLLHGNLYAALRSSPLMVLALPLMLQLVASQLGAAVSARLTKPLSISGRRSTMILAIILAYWAARNVPAYPFTLLAPH